METELWRNDPTFLGPRAWRAKASKARFLFIFSF